jgi:Mrp family chromosome partitioning ATPase
MSTNESFIRAFRHDAARPAPPAPARAHATPAAAKVPEKAAAPAVAAWQTTVEIAAASFAPEIASIETTASVAPSPAPIAPPHKARPLQRPASGATPLSPPPASPPTPATAIGKRPLSSFQSYPAHRETAPRPLRTATASPNLSIFTPETVISAFRWPNICRALWSDYAGQYERVADRLLAVARAGRPIVGVTGINAGDGCTTSLLCLTAALAARRTRLALVDASFCDPQLADVLGAEPTTSWAEVLDRGLPVAEAMIRASHDHIDLLPLRADKRFAGHEAADLVAGVQTSVTAGVLRTAYDLVLVDLGPLLAPGAYAALSHLLRLMPIEAAVLVSNPRTADAHDAAVVGELLEEDGCELLGVIENRAKPPLGLELGAERQAMNQ